VPGSTGRQAKKQEAEGQPARKSGPRHKAGVTDRRRANEIRRPDLHPITFRPRATLTLWPTFATLLRFWMVSTNSQSLLTRSGVIVIAI
jgi:hypothetical protein